MTTVAIVGAGSVGAVAASSAAAAGHRVVLCTRTPFAQLVVVRDGEDHPVSATVVTDPADVAGPADLVALCVKVQDTAATEGWLRRLCGPDTVVVTLQNGLGHVDRVTPLLPAGRVVPAVAYIASERVGPGRIVHHFANRIVLPASPDTATVIAALGPELTVSVTDDFVTAAWRKLLGNVIVNPITALTLRRVNVMADPAIAGLTRALLVEAVATARSVGAELGEEDVEALLNLYRAEWSEQTSGSSMYYDRMAGRPMEHEALTGALVDVAHDHGLAVPHHETVLALLRVIDPATERPG